MICNYLPPILSPFLRFPRVHFSVKTYVKTKEIDPASWGARAALGTSLDPPACQLLSLCTFHAIASSLS